MLVLTFIYLDYRIYNIYYKVFPDRKVGQNSGYALLSTEGIIMGIFGQMSQRADIFQL